ncbi:pheromone A receptor-domain-containing protein [Ephemerocybe angulata]|uniref:Pheromone A receptor-domain-containing protein n=1 Tax=Ephemerocybe angulata TaxID=980116 RepID=A0A8H6I9I6_9AGAR|nr:pheromone A receptor-domain-containing protein [Tulosesus angulatus]
MSPSNQVFSAFSFITFLLVLIPLPWHLEAWNTGTVAYMSWTAISLLNYFVNSVVWNGSDQDYAPIWCDISTRLTIGSAIGIQCASLCINRRLFYISSVQTVTTSKRDKRKEVLVDMSIGVLIPFMMMGLHHIIQGHRYDILEDLGCVPATYNVTLQYLVIQAPALLIPLASVIFATLSVRNFLKRQHDFNKLLSSTGSKNLTASRYQRLMAMACMDVAIALPIAITICVLNATVFGPVMPWVSWEETHFDFWKVNRVAAVFWRSDNISAIVLELSRWLSVVCGLVFFAFFGFAEEARKNYSKAVVWGFNLLGVPSPFKKGTVVGSGATSATLNGSSNFSKFKISTPGTGGNGSNAALPIYVQREVINKRDSLDTFSDFMSVNSEKGGSTTKKYPGLTDTTSTSSPTTATPSRSSSPASGPRVDVSSFIYTDELDSTAMRTPESAFPREVTPVPPSFLEIETPATEGFLSRISSRNPDMQRADNRV